MKRLIVLLSVVFVFVTGCSIQRIDSTDISNNINVLLSEKVNLQNTYFEGYKYYVPKGMKLKNKSGYNAIYLDGHNNKYYLYVDVISYYHKTENKYMVDNEIYYSKELNYNGKTGYINIEKIDDMFYVQFMFNYAKMEAYVLENDLNYVVNNMGAILRTVEFNDAVLESLVGENVLSYQEEDFNLFESKGHKEDLLEVAQDNTTTKDESVFKNDEDFDLVNGN